MKPLISICQFAKATGLNYKLARRLVLSGDVTSKQIGARRRVLAPDQHYPSDVVVAIDAPVNQAAAGGAV
jgi:hypothetical protein